MPLRDNPVETVVQLERQLLDLHRELSALRDFEGDAANHDERFDELRAHLKAEALATIDGIRSLVVHMDRSNTDKATLIVLLAIGFAGEVRASEKARAQSPPEPAQASIPRKHAQ